MFVPIAAPGLLGVAASHVPATGSVQNLLPTYENLSRALNWDDLPEAQKIERIASHLEAKGKIANNETGQARV